MARLTREESKAKTRLLLLDAAKSEFARVGYGGASADVIAENAGFSKGAFYSHFDSKEEIFLELLKRHMEAESMAISELLKGTKDVEEVLKGIEAWIKHTQEDGEWKLLSIELMLQARRNEVFGRKFDELQGSHRKELGKLVKTFFDNAKKKLPEKPERIAGALMGLVHGLALVKTSDNDDENVAGKLTVLILKGLLSLSEKK